MPLLSEISDYVLENGGIEVKIQYTYDEKFFMLFDNLSNFNKKIKNIQMFKDLIKIIENYGKLVGVTYIDLMGDSVEIEPNRTNPKKMVYFELDDKTIQEMIFNLNEIELIAALSKIFREKAKELSQIYPELNIFSIGESITISD